MKPETVTLILVNLAGVMERADESLLPGVYKEVGAALHTDPTGLGSLTLFRSIVQAACYPLAAYLAVRHNRAHVIALGAFLWAAATFLVAFSSTFLQVHPILLLLLILFFSFHYRVTLDNATFFPVVLISPILLSSLRLIVYSLPDILCMYNNECKFRAVARINRNRTYFSSLFVYEY